MYQSHSVYFEAVGREFNKKQICEGSRDRKRLCMHKGVWTVRCRRGSAVCVCWVFERVWQSVSRTAAASPWLSSLQTSCAGMWVFLSLFSLSLQVGFKNKCRVMSSVVCSHFGTLVFSWKHHDESRCRIISCLCWLCAVTLDVEALAFSTSLSGGVVGANGSGLNAVSDILPDTETQIEAGDSAEHDTTWGDQQWMFISSTNHSFCSRLMEGGLVTFIVLDAAAESNIRSF